MQAALTAPAHTEWIQWEVEGDTRARMDQIDEPFPEAFLGNRTRV